VVRRPHCSCMWICLGLFLFRETSNLHRIIFRAFQGVGGAGIFAMTPAIILEMVPPEKFATYNAVASSTIGISFLLGPLVGGAISNRSSWRWIFFIKYAAIFPYDERKLI